MWMNAKKLQMNVISMLLVIILLVVIHVNVQQASQEMELHAMVSMYMLVDYGLSWFSVKVYSKNTKHGMV